MALEEYSEYFMYGGVILTVAVTVFFFLLERQHKSDVSGIKDYLSSNRWQGEVMQTNIESWKKQTPGTGIIIFMMLTSSCPMTSNYAQRKV